MEVWSEILCDAFQAYLKSKGQQKDWERKESAWRGKCFRTDAHKFNIAKLNYPQMFLSACHCHTYFRDTVNILEGVLVSLMGNVL